MFLYPQLVDFSQTTEISSQPSGKLKITWISFAFVESKLPYVNQRLIHAYAVCGRLPNLFLLCGLFCIRSSRLLRRRKKLFFIICQHSFSFVCTVLIRSLTRRETWRHPGDVYSLMVIFISTYTQYWINQPSLQHCSV